MRSRTIGTLALAAIAIAVDTTTAFAVRPTARATAIHVDDMHCKTCAKKIARKLYAVPGVVAVHADVDKDVALVTPQKNKDLSPRALWEAVQAAKFKPVKLVGPHGTFLKKPSR